MKISHSALSSRRISQAVFFGLVLLLAVKANAQQTSPNSIKPQAILVGEWTEPSKTSHSEVLPLRSAVRARIFDALDGNSTAAAATVESASNVGYSFAAHAKSSAKFAYLKPTPLEQKAFNLINDQRRLQDLPPLEWDLGMLYVARQHSENMAKYNFFSHQGTDGKTADNRANEAGIRDWRAIGENIAFNQNVKDQVDFAVQCWLKSSSHKENLLSKKWTRSGIGVSVTSDGKFYITQVFMN